MEPTYLTDAFARTLRTTVTAVQPRADGSLEVSTVDTVFHPTGGGQPSDLGTLEWAGHVRRVVDARHGLLGTIWHALDGMDAPDVGAEVQLTIDWERRYRLMRTHSAAHLLCAIAADHFGASVSGCEMGELHGRLDFDGLPGGIADELNQHLTAALATSSSITLSWLDRNAAAADEDLVRTKTNLVPSHVERVRVVTIGELDRQADGGTHVGNTDEIGRVRVSKVENKGKGRRRVRFTLD